MFLSKEQVEILKHTNSRAAGGFYCGDSPDMQELVKLGLMELAGRKSFVPDPYFRLTKQGSQTVQDMQNIMEQAKQHIPDEEHPGLGLVCPQCGGNGYTIGSGSEHAPDCDGSCENCPVEVPTQEPCAMCAGCGRISQPD